VELYIIEVLGCKIYIMEQAVGEFDRANLVNHDHKIG
jgi:hypothetical protein